MVQEKCQSPYGSEANKTAFELIYIKIAKTHTRTYVYIQYIFNVLYTMKLLHLVL